MPTLFQINTVCNSGSTGRIAEELGNLVMRNGWKSYIAYGRGFPFSNSNIYRIGTDLDLYRNVLIARVWDNDGFCQKRTTDKLIAYIDKIKPDIIHLHNLHGYYLNIEKLFTYLSVSQIPVVWTLHDCWSFTGHCTHFDFIGCQLWKSECNGCPEKRSYPTTYIFDRSHFNFCVKKRILSHFKNLTIITPSEWLASLVKESILKEHFVYVINNGINISSFYPRETSHLICKYQLENKKIILGVAGNWDERKGLNFFVELSTLINVDYKIIVIGVSRKQKGKLPTSILGIERTENIDELASFYTLADVYVNPTLEDNFPTTNLEALACGTPVVTFKTGGSSESVGIDESCGIIVEQVDLCSLIRAVNKIVVNGKQHYTEACVKRVDILYDAQERFGEYQGIYNKKLKK